MKSKYAELALAAFAITGMLALLGCGDSKAIATINGQKITKGELDEKLESQSGKVVLGQMINQDLIFQYAKQNNIEISDAEIQKKLSEYASRFPAGRFESMLKAQGLTLDDAKMVVREQLILQKAVRKDIHVNDAAVADYFSKNHAAFDQPGQVRARHILVKTKAEADMIEAQLKAGANFADLAKKYSTDPGTKDQGGELGWFGKGQMVPAFQQVAFALPPGQTSAPVQTPFGWHIIQVEQKKPAVKASLANSRDKAREQLETAQEQQLAPGFLQKLRDSAKIAIEDPRFQDLLPATPGPSSPPAAPAASAAPTK